MTWANFEASSGAPASNNRKNLASCSRRRRRRHSCLLISIDCQCKLSSIWPSLPQFSLFHNRRQRRQQLQQQQQSLPVSFVGGQRATSCLCVWFLFVLLTLQTKSTERNIHGQAITSFTPREREVLLSLEFALCVARSGGENSNLFLHFSLSSGSEFF